MLTHHQYYMSINYLRNNMSTEGYIFLHFNSLWMMILESIVFDLISKRYIQKDIEVSWR